jgi:putative NADH-flavin reductase
VPFVEITRKIVLASRAAKVPYFIMVGGTGSLYVPGQDHLCAGEYGHFWRAFRQSIADSEAHVQYMEERLGPLGIGLRTLRNARQKVRNGTATQEDLKYMKDYYEQTFRGDYSQTFVKAARVTWMFFDGNTSSNWSYASPPARYRPCTRGEEYKIGYDFLPLSQKPRPEFYLGWDKEDSEDIEGRLEGISTADFARALADDAETQAQKGKHWTAYTPFKDDTPHPSYAKFPPKR